MSILGASTSVRRYCRPLGTLRYCKVREIERSEARLLQMAPDIGKLAASQRSLLQGMKYQYYSAWLHDGDAAALVSRLAALFRRPGMRNAVLKPRSLKLKPTAKNLATLAAPPRELPPYSFDWIIPRNEKSVQGGVSITPSTPSRLASFIEHKFSLNETYRGGPFRKVEEVLDLALACMAVGPSGIGCVEPMDKSASQLAAESTTFRAVDSWVVPVTIEWITLLHRDVVVKLGIDLTDAEQVSGVRVGLTNDFWWLILTPHPFRFTNQDDVTTRDYVTKALGLADLHAKFPR